MNLLVFQLNHILYCSVAVVDVHCTYLWEVSMVIKDTINIFLQKRTSVKVNDNCSLPEDHGLHLLRGCGIIEGA